MPKIASNVLAVKSRLRGDPGVFQIIGIEGLHLAVLGDGRGSWRIRYRPRRGAAQRWYTLGDARTVELGDAIRKARELLTQVQLEGLDPHTENDRLATAQLTFTDVYREWLEVLLGSASFATEPEKSTSGFSDCTLHRGLGGLELRCWTRRR